MEINLEVAFCDFGKKQGRGDKKTALELDLRTVIKSLDDYS